MCTASLCVFISEISDPCHIVDDRHRWFLHVLDCHGKIVSWCGEQLTNLETKCGHREIRVPPGCYVVCATWSPGSGSGSLGNHLTHCAIVQAKCDERVCITLFNPSLHTCGTHFGHAVRDAVRAGNLPREALRAAETLQGALQDFLRHVPADEVAQNIANLGVEERPNPPTKRPAK